MKRDSASVIANSQSATVKPLHDRRLLLLGFWVPVESIANDATGGRCHSAAAGLAQGGQDIGGRNLYLWHAAI
jgi:hypothetical protein